MALDKRVALRALEQLVECLEDDGIVESATNGLGFQATELRVVTYGPDGRFRAEAIEELQPGVRRYFGIAVFGDADGRLEADGR